MNAVRILIKLMALAAAGFAIYWAVYKFMITNAYHATKEQVTEYIISGTLSMLFAVALILYVFAGVNFLG